jgi:transcriptional regulator with XRE-family HTH domain
MPTGAWHGSNDQSSDALAGAVGRCESGPMTPQIEPGGPVGAVIRARREALFLSREALGSRAGLSSATVKRVESGTVRPHAQTLQALRRALRITDAPVPDGGSPTVRVVITDLRAIRALTDPELHPERRDEAERVSATLDHLIEDAEQAARP